MTAIGAHDASAVPEAAVPAVPDTLGLAFQASVARVPDRVALRTPGGEHLTWAQFGVAVERLAGAFAGLGVRHGDRVAFWSHNRPELAIASVAAAHLGAAVVASHFAAPPRLLRMSCATASRGCSRSKKGLLTDFRPSSTRSPGW